MKALYGKPTPPVEMVEVLLIGGANDGKRLMVTKDVYMIRHSVMHPFVYTPAEVADYSAHGIDLTEYHRVPFGLSDGMRKGEFILFLHESIKMDMFDVVQLLYMGYRRGKNDDVNS